MTDNVDSSTFYYLRNLAFQFSKKWKIIEIIFVIFKIDLSQN